MWDAWYLEHRGQAHMFHLQTFLPEQHRHRDENTIGHAVSGDLIHWVERPSALGPNASGTLDDLMPWTGCVTEYAGRFYLYYTMRSSTSQARRQRIGLALSDDLEHWERYAGNPVITPDPRWYVSHEHPLACGLVDCRDLVVVPDPKGDGWLGFYAAMQHSEELAEGAVIALVRSPDLLHWESLPPAFAPRKYSVVEVPDVFPLDGRWYMTCLTGHVYGNRGIFCDPYVTHGTIYAVADRAEGPYREIEGDNTLVGGDATCGYSCRSIVFEGERHVLYIEPVPDSPALLSPPFRACATAGGQLRLAYSSRMQAWRGRRLLAVGEVTPIAGMPAEPNWSQPTGRWQVDGRAYRGECRTGWQEADLGVGAANVEIEARISVQDSFAAGLVWRPDSTAAHYWGDLAILLEPGTGTVRAARLPVFGDPYIRRCPLEAGQTYHMRVCLRDQRCEVFVNDFLYLQFAVARPSSARPSIGCLVDRGRAVVEDLAIYELAA
jgi:beta-fructofuranosidase